jgi:hypothetical protein
MAKWRNSFKQMFSNPNSEEDGTVATTTATTAAGTTTLESNR